MKFWRYLKKARVALKNLENVLEAFYKHQTLLGERNAAVEQLASFERRLEDFNLRRQLFLEHSNSEILTKREDLAAFFEARRPVFTNHELIRVGGIGDGGYLVPDDLEGITSVFSPGVDTSSKFELFFAERGVKCYLVDGSVEKAPVSHVNFNFRKNFVHQGPSSGSWINFNDWVVSNSPMDGNSILQMDIEGGEWQILNKINDTVLTSFRIIVIEFHGLHQLAYATSFETIKNTMELLEIHFDLVHLHPNNAESAQKFAGFEVPPTIEATYIRKDRVTKRSPQILISHPLDSKNIENLPPVSLGAFQETQRRDS